MLSALAYLHDRSIVHRDIKPENVLFVGDTVKLADFGSANFLDQVRRETVCGTPEYIAPEMVMKKGHDQKADVWGFGVLFFELLQGKTPFSVSHRTDLRSQEAMFQQLMHNILVRAAHQHSDIQMRKSLSHGATDLVLKCLNRNPERRWSVHALLRHPFFAKHLRHPSESTQHSAGDRSTFLQSNLNIVLSSKVTQKVLPEDDADLEDLFKSNTTPFVSPSSFNSTLDSPVHKSEEHAKLLLRIPEPTEATEAHAQEDLAASNNHTFGPQTPAPNNLLALSQQELKLEGDLEFSESSKKQHPGLFPYPQLTQVEISPSRNPPDLQGTSRPGTQRESAERAVRGRTESESAPL